MNADAIDTAVPVVLITGASSGIGRLTARRLAASGFRVFGTSRAGAVVESGVEMLPLDVSRPDSVEECMRRLWARTGRVDVLVNNAGCASIGACEETTVEEAMALFQTNFFGLMRVTSAVLPEMRRRRSGRIVNIGSLAGFVGAPFHGVYAASKHAVAGYSEALRLEVKRFGVWVSLVEPDAHRTGIALSSPVQGLSFYEDDRSKVASLMRRNIDTGGDPERIVDAIVAASTTAAPRFRYRVGGTARLAAWGRRILPDAVFEHLMRREFGIG